MSENSPNNNVPDAHDAHLRRKIIGFLLFPIALFPFLALASYDWHSVAALQMPPLRPTANLIGVAGDAFAYTGYTLLGLAVWVVPFLCIFVGLLLVLGRPIHPGRRTFWLTLFVTALACLLQLLGATPGVSYLLHVLNIAPNAGGALGYLIMTRCLSRLLSPFGSGVLMICLMLMAIIFTVGVRAIVSALWRLTAWATAPEEGEGTTAAAAEGTEKDDADMLSPEAVERQEAAERRAAEKDEERRLAAEAKEAARAEKEAEKQRKAQEKEAAKAAKLAAKTATGQPTPADAEVPDKGPYLLPPVDLLNSVPKSTADHGDTNEMSNRLIATLKQFDVETTLAYTVPGPVVTQYALTPAPNVKVERIAGLAANLQMALEAKSLRIEAPIPGKNAVGIEVPNRKAAPVTFREIIDGDLWNHNKFQVPLLLGKDATGHDLIVDLAKMPHLLVAGATGMGKSVCLNSIINGLLMSRTPEQVRFILIDPKRVEFTTYNKLPHLLVPVINDTQKVVFGLRWAVTEMNKRLRMFSKVGCRNIVDFNTRPQATQPDLFGGADTPVQEAVPATIPYIVIVIDEVADIMLAAGKEVEPVVARLTALSRATGIHLILATQRPDTKTITGTIKSNIPGRIAFKTSQGIDSRTILDATGAEDLIGRGDMLFRAPEGNLIRAQGSFISDEEINRIVDFIGEHASVKFDDAFSARLEKIKEADPEDMLKDDDETATAGGDAAAEPSAPPPPPSASGIPAPAGFTDEEEAKLYAQALDVVRRTKRASTSHLQRRMGIGYNHAARLIDLLEDRGVIGPARGAGPREILIDLSNEVPVNDAGNAPAAAEPAPPPTPKS